MSVQLEDGSVVAGDSSTTTLAHPAMMAGPINMTERSFTLAIVDESNPPETEYLLTLVRDDGEFSFPSGWSSSRCRTFEGLEIGKSYIFEVVAKNLDGIETEPVGWIWGELRLNGDWATQARSGPSDLWLRDQLEDAAFLYGLTERARTWLLSDMYFESLRNEPGYAGYIAPDLVRVGRGIPPYALIHETMHGYWEHWDNFPEPCGEMNIYTFKRDFAQFMLDFRRGDESSVSNPWESWRPFYNTFAVLAENYSGATGESAWDALDRGDYDELWGHLYHVAYTDIPVFVAGRLSLIPPTIRPYFKGFIDDQGEAAWHDELIWYISLPSEDRYLWDTAFRYSYIVDDSPEYHEIEPSAPTSISEPLRQRLRDADRQRLVDFINTLEDISRSVRGEELWRADFNFWAMYVVENLRRARFYLDELSADTGIELDQENLDSVRGVIGAIADDLFCGQWTVSEAVDAVNSAEEISELQRAAFLAMIEVRDRTQYRTFPCVSWSP